MSNVRTLSTIMYNTFKTTTNYPVFLLKIQEEISLKRGEETCQKNNNINGRILKNQ